MTENGRPNASTPARRTARLILIASAFLLPTLSLIPLGGFYLWEKGWMLWWAIGALVAVAVALLLQRALLSQATQVAENRASPTTDVPSELQSNLERLAWTDVRAIATKVDVDKLDTADAIIELGQKTVDAVARRLHPEKSDAVWRFTLPQALAIAERVSARLGEFVDTRIPFGDRLTVAQLLSIYGWRRYIGVAEQAYDVWRVIRMANPVTAVTQEARERLSRSLMLWGKEQVSRRIAEAFVEEVGRAAIDLYSGRLPTSRPAEESQEGLAKDGLELAGPLSIVVTGADETERLALAADLEVKLRERAVSRIDAVQARVINSGAVHPLGFARRQLTRAVSAADAVLWVVSAEEGPSEGDENAVAELRRHFAASQAAVPPALIVAASRAPTDAVSDLARYVGELAHGFARPDGTDDAVANAIVALAPTGQARDADLSHMAHRVMQSAARVRAMRGAIQHRRRAGRRGLWASAGQAATAVGGLAGALLKPRIGERER